MARVVELLLLVIVMLLTAPKSRAVHPFHQAFSPLKEAFGDSFMDLKPSIEVETLFTMPKNVENLNPISEKSTEINNSKSNDNITSGAGSSEMTPEMLKPPPPILNLETFTFNRNNTKRKDDIFSVLADVVKDQSQKTESLDEEHLINNTIPNRRISQPETQGNQGSANDFSKTIIHVVKNIENVLSTMSFMKNLYHTKRRNVTATPPPSSQEASSVLDVILDVPTLEGIRTAGLTARSEKEFLDHVTSVLIGAETRSSALTLDPVTVIALLTLAAYLLRAVYQIIAVTGRSFDVSDGDLNLSLSDLPDALTRIHNWISSTNIDFNRDERVTREVKDNLNVPGDLAAVLKLYRKGQASCVKRFLCQQVHYRPWRTLKLSDMMIGLVSYYYGETSLSHYIDNELLADSESICSRMTPVELCSQETLSDANSLKIIFGSAAEKALSLAATYNNWL